MKPPPIATLILVAVLFLTQATGLAHAAGDGELSAELAAALGKAAADDAFSGAVLAAKDGQPIFRRAYGLANKGTNSPNTMETKFNIGSMNKMFTAVAVAQLAERGKLSFDDTIARHLPDYPNQAIAGKVTIHQLLTHTSGLGNYQNERYLARLDEMKTIADLLPLFIAEPLAFEPGTKWQYSNAATSCWVQSSRKCQVRATSIM